MGATIGSSCPSPAPASQTQARRVATRPATAGSAIRTNAARQGLHDPSLERSIRRRLRAAVDLAGARLDDEDARRLGAGIPSRRGDLGLPDHALPWWSVIL